MKLLEKSKEISRRNDAKRFEKDIAVTQAWFKRSLDNIAFASEEFNELLQTYKDITQKILESEEKLQEEIHSHSLIDFSKELFQSTVLFRLTLKKFIEQNRTGEN